MGGFCLNGVRAKVESASSRLPNSLIQHPSKTLHGNKEWGPYAIWLSPLMDAPKMDQGKFGGPKNVPGPILVCGAAASLLCFADGKETLPGLII